MRFTDLFLILLTNSINVKKSHNTITSLLRSVGQNCVLFHKYIKSEKFNWC